MGEPFRRALGPSLLLLTGCAPPLTHLTPVEGARSALAHEVANDEALLLAIALGPNGAVELPERFEDGATLSVFFLPWRLEELQLREGLLPPTPPLMATRRIPTPLASFEGRTGLGASEWRALANDEAIRETIRLPTLDLNRCVEEGGCLARFEDRNLACTLPCPAPTSPAPPTPPTILADGIPAPTEPSPPVFEPCPNDWNTVSAEAPYPATCTPPEPPASVGCGPGEAQFYAEATCRHVGPSCPSGDFAEVPAELTGPVFHVRAGGPPGGDGTVEAPFGSMAEAMMAVPDESILLLSKGTFAERVRVERPLHFVGACVEETLIVPPANEGCCTPLFEVATDRDTSLRSIGFRGATSLLWASGDSRLRISDLEFNLETERSWALVASARGAVTGVNLVARGDGEEAFYASSDSLLDLSNIVVEAGVTAIRVDGETARLNLSDAVIREPPGGVTVRGLLVSGGGRMTGGRVHVDRSTAIALEANGMAEVQLGDFSVASSVPLEPSGNPIVHVVNGAQVAFERVFIQRGDGVLFRALDRGSSLSLKLGVVRAAEPTRVGGDFGAFHVTDAELELDQVLIEDNAGPGVWLEGDARGTLRDVILRRNELARELDNGPGAALYASGTPYLRVERGIVRENNLGGLRLVDQANAHLSDLVVTGQRRLREGAPEDGSGIFLQGANHMTLERAVLGDNDAAALWLQGPSTATLTHARVASRRERETQTDLVVASGGSLTASRVRTVGATFAVGGAHLHISESEVVGSRISGPPVAVGHTSELFAERVALESPDPTHPALLITDSIGRVRDILARGGAVSVRQSVVEIERLRSEGGDVKLESTLPVTAEDVEVLDPPEHGINLGTNGQATFRRVRVSGAMSRALRLSEGSQATVEDLVLEASAVGLATFDAAQLTARRFRVSDNTSVGLLFDPSVFSDDTRTISLEDGEIARQPVGVRRYDGYDIAHVMVRVRFQALPTAIE